MDKEAGSSFAPDAFACIVKFYLRIPFEDFVFPHSAFAENVNVRVSSRSLTDTKLYLCYNSYYFGYLLQVYLFNDAWSPASIV